MVLSWMSTSIICIVSNRSACARTHTHIYIHMYVEWFVGRAMSPCKWPRIKYIPHVSNHHFHLGFYICILFSTSCAKYGLKIIHHIQYCTNTCWGCLYKLLCTSHKHFSSPLALNFLRDLNLAHEWFLKPNTFKRKVLRRPQ